MPTKTIYVSEDDLPVFEEAQVIAKDNLSSTIIRALRAFIVSEKAQQEQFETMTIKVGKCAPYRVVQFKGRLLGRQIIHPEQNMRKITLAVYLTMHNHFALRAKNVPDWTAWTGRSEKDWGEVSWSSMSSEPELELRVVDSLEELRHFIPEELFTIVNHSLNGPEVEFLDI